MYISNYNLKPKDLHNLGIIFFIGLFLFMLIYNIYPKSKPEIARQNITIFVANKNRELKQTDSVIKSNRGGLYKSQTTIYDYWKITDKNDKTYTIPKENDGLYNKIELNKLCFITVNTDVSPNIILDIKYCN